NMAVNELHISRMKVMHVQHDEERREIQQLNDTFAMYLKRVQNLEEANKQLSVQILALRDRWGKLFTKIRLIILKYK
ncbi:unnamed protein product, partial [Rotaria magnacalcarata]